MQWRNIPWLVNISAAWTNMRKMNLLTSLNFCVVGRLLCNSMSCLHISPNICPSTLRYSCPAPVLSRLSTCILPPCLPASLTSICPLPRCGLQSSSYIHMHKQRFKPTEVLSASRKFWILYVQPASAPQTWEAWCEELLHAQQNSWSRCTLQHLAELRC